MATRKTVTAAPAPAPAAEPAAEPAPAPAAAPAEVKCSKCDELEARLARVEKFLDQKWGF